MALLPETLTAGQSGRLARQVQINKKLNAGHIDVKADFGATGDGATDDTTAINAAIAASSAGSTIFFPAATYIISAPIILLPSRTYLGGGHALASPSAATFKLKSGTNLTNTAGLTGLLVAQGWSNNASVCDYPMRIVNIAIDGNKSNNTSSTACGIVLCNFWTWIQDCYIHDIPKHGILLTDTGADGATVISNTASENRIMRNKITTVGGDGFRLVCNNNNSNMDGFCTDNLISYTTGAGMNLDRSAGWTFRRNHFYGIGDNAMWLGSAYSTTVESNYIEDFGNNNVASNYYLGIAFNQLNGRSTTVTNNFVGCSEPSTNVSYYQYIAATANSSQTDAQVVIADNTIAGGSGSNGTGIVVQHKTGGVMTAEVLGNRIAHVNAANYYDAADTTNTPALTASPTFTGTVTLPKVQVKTGTNLAIGTATLVAGTVTVSNTAVTANSVILLTPQNASGTAGSVSVSARTAGTSFTILSTSNTDTRKIAWMIVEPV